MPAYSYRCKNCQRRFRVFLSYEEYGEKVVRCSHCESENVERLIGRVRFARSEESRLESLESLADPSALAGLEDDPRALGQMMRKMSNEMGEDLGPEFTEVVDRLEKGQSPEDIERDMPDLGADMGGEMGGMDDF